MHGAQLHGRMHRWGSALRSGISDEQTGEICLEKIICQSDSRSRFAAMGRAAPAAKAALEAQEEAVSQPPPEQPEQPEKQPPPPPPLSQQPPPAATAAALDMFRELDPDQTEEKCQSMGKRVWSVTNTAATVVQYTRRRHYSHTKCVVQDSQ